MDNNQYQQNNINDNNIKNNERQGRGLFYGVVAVATFIIMAVGATFAYFAATASSANTSVTTGSTSISLTLLSYESSWAKNKLIPADTDIVKYAFANQSDGTLKGATETNTCYNSEGTVVGCDDESVDSSKTTTTISDYGKYKNTMCIDDYGNEVCSVYVFQIVNDNASPQTMAFEIIGQRNDFTNLRAMAFEISAPESGTSDYISYNKTSFGDPSSFTVMNGSTQVADTDYTPVYVNRPGTVKTILSYTGDDASADDNGEAKNRPLLHVGVDGEDDAPTDSNLSNRTTKVANGVEIGSGETKTYAIVLYIFNLNVAQDEDEDSIFQGSISVTTGDGQGVSGYINQVVSNRETSSNG